MSQFGDDASGAKLPHRPRIAEHGMLRRHLVQGEEKLVLHDGIAEEIIELSEEQLTQLRGCDGTRDLGGIMLAASRAGAYRRASDIEAMLLELHGRGMLTDGIAATHPKLGGRHRVGYEPSDRPLRVLPDYRLRCDGHGSCCTTYSSIPFTADEARRAILAVPELDREIGGDRLFLPLYGSADGPLCAVTMRDGRCCFLAEDGLCRVHAAAGAEAKPRGCQGFPACYVDDGVALRVSAAVECACVLRSLDAEGGVGAPLLAADKRVSGDLEPATPIAALPLRVAVTPELDAPREQLAPWADAVSDALSASEDAVAAFWSLAQAVGEHGLDPDAAVRALAQPSPPLAAAIGFRVLALAGKTADKRESTAAWRSPLDRARRLSAWLDHAAQALSDIATAGARLSGPGDFDRQEAFYLRSTLWGHQLLSHRHSLAQSLRDRAIRVLLARQCAADVVAECADDPSARYPLTAVEAMMRGQGLDGYSQGLA